MRLTEASFCSQAAGETKSSSYVGNLRSVASKPLLEIESQSRFLNSDSLLDGLFANTNPSMMSANTASQGLSLTTIEIINLLSGCFFTVLWNFAVGGGDRKAGTLNPLWFAIRSSVLTTFTNFIEYDSAIKQLWIMPVTF